MLTYHHTHIYYEADIEVYENISIDVEDGGMILEKKDSETVTNYNRKYHESHLKHDNIEVVVW